MHHNTGKKKKEAQHVSNVIPCYFQKNCHWVSILNSNEGQEK
jgi:hypothetical protein